MRFIDLTYDEPARNLALDEVILDSVEAGRAPDTLRLWESQRTFVVIGSGQRYRDVVHYFNCLRDGTPVLRRCSAGGAVLQGTGCLNFAIAARYENNPGLADLHSSYSIILDKIVSALQTLTIHAKHEGISDLAINGLKCSGNAQRRKRLSCLHHGTLVYKMNLDAMARYLPEPKDRPEYRGKRTHSEFMTVLPSTPNALRGVIKQALAPDAQAEHLLPEERTLVEELADDKYADEKWNFRR